MTDSRDDNHTYLIRSQMIDLLRKVTELEARKELSFSDYDENDLTNNALYRMRLSLQMLEGGIRKYIETFSSKDANFITRHFGELQLMWAAARADNRKLSPGFSKNVDRFVTQGMLVAGIAERFVEGDSTQTYASHPVPNLPDIKPAPMQVEIKNNFVELSYSQRRTGGLDYASLNRTREGLRQTLEDIVFSLPSQTNIDRRYINACQQLLFYFSVSIQNVSIEAFGLQYQLVRKITNRVAEQLGETVLDEIEHVLSNTGVLLNQFEEWREFLIEQEKIRLEAKTGADIIDQVKELTEDLEAPGAPVSPSVVKRLREMIDPVLNGTIEAEAVAVPLILSLSNLFSTLSQFAVDHVYELTIQPSRAAALGSGAILLTFAVDLIRKFGPALSKSQPLKFILDVAAYIGRLYSPVKDFLIK